MKEFLQKLFLGHVHKWEQKFLINVVKKEGDIPYSKIIVLQCEICGDIKNHKIVDREYI